MQTDMWYDLALRALSGEDTIAELLREAEIAQQPVVDEQDDEDLEQDDQPLTAR
jgi:hypothetical protein